MGRVTVTPDNVHIRDSYLTNKTSDMLVVLMEAKVRQPFSNVWTRSSRSLINEWKAHNLLYRLGIFRKRTADVDLDYPPRWYTETGYALLRIFNR